MIDPPSQAKLSPPILLAEKNQISEQNERKEPQNKKNKKQQNKKQKTKKSKNKQNLQYSSDCALNTRKGSEQINFISFFNLSKNPGSIDPPPQTKMYILTKVTNVRKNKMN